MSKVKLTLKIPQSLADITLGQYQEYLKVLDGLREGKKPEEELSEGELEFLNKKSLQIFCGVDLKEAYDLPLKIFMFALEQIQICFSEETPLIREFVFKDDRGVEQRMGFIPNLEEMTFGEYVDLDSFVVDWQQCHKAMAVLFRRKTDISNSLYRIDKYRGQETLDWYAEAMKNMPVNIALGALLFFYRLGTKLAVAMTNFLEASLARSSQSSDNSQKDGDGIRALLHSSKLLQTDMKETANLMRFQRFHSVLH